MNGAEVVAIHDRLAALMLANDTAHSLLLKEIKEINGRVRRGEVWMAKMEGAAGAVRVAWVVGAAGAGMLAGIGGGIITIIVGG